MTVPSQDQDAKERRVRRMAITLFDAMDTVEFAHALLQEADANAGLPDGATERALTLATIVSYARPYSRNRKSDNTEGSLASEFVSQMSPTETAVHARVIAMRDQAFAHSDAAFAPVVLVTKPGALPMANHTPSRVRLKSTEIVEIRELARRLMGWCIEECTRLGFPSVGAQGAREWPTRVS